jgi:hypothetical protein
MEPVHHHPDRSGINRYGEDHIKPDYYEDEFGMRHSRTGELEHPIDWSHDTRSESSLENHQSHRGKGPKNFSRTDAFLREEVCEALLLDPYIDAERIDVEVKDGIVTLHGHVRTRDDRWLVEDLVREISGVKDVENRISRWKWDIGDDPGGLIKGIR